LNDSIRNKKKMNERQFKALTNGVVHTTTAQSVQWFIASQTGKAALRTIGICAATASGTVSLVYAGLIMYDVYQFMSATSEEEVLVTQTHAQRRME
jgi:hypothetical protein